MRCKSCDYSLWRIRGRLCPECGAPFKPTDFEFVANSVEFACPHCDTIYYGDDPNGRLWPAEFDCVGCGRHVHTDEMILSPVGGLAHDRSETRKMPWLQRRKIGRFRAWFQTIGLALFAPGELIELTPPKSSLSEAFRFWFRMQMAIWPIAAVPLLGLLGVGLATALTGRGAGGAGAVLIAIYGGVVLAGLALSFLATAAFALISHGLLRITGRTEHGLRRTFQAAFYSSGANVPTAIPCVGVYIGWIWWLISATVMVRRGHRIGAGRAVFAVVGPVLTVVVVCGGAYAWGVYYAMSKASVAMATASVTAAAAAPAAQRAAGLAKTMAQAAALPTDPGRPSHMHIAELMAAGSVEPGVVLSAAGATSRSFDQVRIGSLTLMEFAKANLSARDRAAREATDGLDPAAPSYRFGDFVFTYPARKPLDPGQIPAAARVWVFVEWPERGSRPLPAAVQIGLLDGSVVEQDRASFPAALEEQNGLRRELGLPALPAFPAEPAATDPEKPGG